MFSVGLGLAELLAPRKVARLAGISERHERLLQAMGVRELASGLGIMQGKPAAFLWSRVAGDMADLGLLAAEWRSDHADRRRLQIAIAAVAGVTLLDVLAGILHTQDRSEPGWRVNESGSYEPGIERGTPQAMREACDDAMARHSFRHEPDGDEQVMFEDPAVDRG